MEKITLNQFLDDCHKKEELLMFTYNSLWNNITKDENILKKENIIEVSNKGINNKIYVLDSEKLVKYFKKKLSKRKKSIRSFIRETDIELSYSTIYAFIVNNEERLKSLGVVNIYKKGKSPSTIEIVDFDKLKSEIEKG